ncbi:MAG: phage tail protein, partial [Alphaproteobacteria bacterium]
KVLFAWRNEILKGKADVRDIGNGQLDSRGETVVNAWLLVGAWPTSWIGPVFDAQRSAAAFEEIEVLYRDILWL